MDIIQIVPRLPPATDGVGDYALRVATQLRAAHQIESHFVVGDPTWHSDRTLKFDAATLRHRSGTDLIAALRAKGSIRKILLNYVGYGYARRGYPRWLVKGLKDWLRSKHENSLNTVFHELYAFGPPWTSSFWISPLQKRSAKVLALLSRKLITPMERYAQILKSFGVHSQIIKIPVFSNVGEVSSPKPLRERKPQMVVFGNRLRRAEIYSSYRLQLIEACRGLGLEAIVDVGSPLPNSPDLPVGLIEKGVQGTEEITALLSDSRAGFLTYFDGYLAKSGVFAAYCAHGVLPILPSRNSSELDAIHHGAEYLLVDQIPATDTDINTQQIANNAHRWYQEHSIAETASKMAETLKKSAN
jgi:hypothetical protein